MRFAYMIMAHNEPYVLNKLIEMLDYPNNDLFIHVDKNSTSIDSEKLKTKKAQLTVIQSRSVSWGGCSQINCILDLLSEALKSTHDYYHLISGQDLPIKSNVERVTFFKKNNGKEFIGVTQDWASSSSIAHRYELHWFWQDKIGKKKNLIWLLSRIISRTEMNVGYKRKNGDICFYGGPVWFSITEKAAAYLLSQGEWIRKRFKNTICCDEIYAQTIICNSFLKSHIYEADDSHAQCMRYVRFNGESPFVLDLEDFDNLIHSDCMFARKFGTETQKEKELVDKIYDLYK